MIATLNHLVDIFVLFAFSLFLFHLYMVYIYFLT